ncbi:MAG TPA: SDR family oxidoreductase [Streptosporangiaceae bacterium]|nr:SDR family oxidoreductase [Streptosporangiaceae bacterium]
MSGWPDALTAAVTDGIEQLGRLDIVCGNAGIGSCGLGWELTPQAWAEMISVNLTGTWNTTRATIPALLAQGQGGAIILTSSSAAIHSIPYGAHYSAAKRGVVGLAQELGPHRIRVNTVHPTGVSTPMILNDFTYLHFLPAAASPSSEDIKPLLAGMNAIPVPWVEPIDVSNAVLFLASDKARYVTGRQLTVDAGTSIKYAGT